jgi:hypothetical protein
MRSLEDLKDYQVGSEEVSGCQEGDEMGSVDLMDCQEGRTEISNCQMGKEEKMGSEMSSNQRGG